MFRSKRSLLLLVLSLSVSGCTGGLFIPEMQEPGKAQDSERFDENVLISQVKCEIHSGLQRVLAANAPKPTKEVPNPGNPVDWIRDWGAKVTLALTVDVKGSTNPGVSFLQPLENELFRFSKGGTVTAPQSFALGVGLTASSDATRKETIGFTYSFKDLLAEKHVTDRCDNEDGILVHSDLKIQEFMTTKAFLARVPGTLGPPSKPGPFTNFTYEATFVVVYGGNVTPTWKLAQISANTANSFLASMRTKTNDITITMGKIQTPETSTAAPTLGTEAEQAHLAALIGQSVALAIQSQSP